MKFRISVIAIIFLFSCASLRESYSVCNFPEHAPFPGGIINMMVDISSFYVPEVNIEGKSVYLCQVDKNSWRVLAPIGLLTKKNKVNIYHKKKLILSIPITNKEYRESKISIRDQDMVYPPTEYLPRIEKESRMTSASFTVLTKSYLSSIKMSSPVKGPKSSEFGVKRFINDQPRNRHLGLDIAAVTGTQIIAPLSGKVILVGNFYYRGNTVFLNHGGGLISTYSHLDEILVKEQDFVQQNQVIGKVGQTGRVTGSHLHWQIVLSGIPVDPELFLEEQL